MMPTDHSKARRDRMDDQPHGCLSPESLAGLARGDASEELIEFAARHFSECQACRTAFDTMPISGMPPASSESGLPRRAHFATPPDEFAASGDPRERMPDFGTRFRTLRTLGEGGMGTVYQCFDQRLRRVVAIKLLKNDSVSGQFLKRMQREARIQASLSHPEIVAIHEAGLFAGHPGIVMEYVPGPSLKKILADDTLSSQDSARLVARVARALQHAHTNGVLHRDLKPANILIRGSDDHATTPMGGSRIPKIADFGLARLVDEDSDLTHSGLVVGTPAYCSPEAFSSDRKNVDRRSDIYSLGCVLYECLVGRPPFQANSFARIASLIQETIPLSPRQIDPAISRDLETICLKCLEKDPAQRYADAESLAEDLEAFLDGRPIQARPTPALVRGWRWCRRNRGLATGIAVAVVSLVSLTVASLLFARSQAELSRIASENGYKAVRQSEIANQAVQRANLQRDQARLLFVASSRVLHDIGNMLNLARFNEPSVERNKQIYAEFQKRLLDLSDLYLKRTDLDDDSPDMLPLSIYNAARAHATLGNDAEAIRHFEWLIDLNGKKPPTTAPTETYRHLVTAGMLELSEIYARIGQKGKAIALLRPFWENPVDPATGQPVATQDTANRQLRIFFGEKLKAIYYDLDDKPNFERLEREIERLRRADLPAADNATKPPNRP